MAKKYPTYMYEVTFQSPSRKGRAKTWIKAKTAVNAKARVKAREKGAFNIKTKRQGWLWDN